MFTELVTRLTAPLATVFAVSEELGEAIQASIAANLATLEALAALSTLTSARTA